MPGHHGILTGQPASDRIILATDTSIRRKLMGQGYIATSGHYGYVSRHQSAESTGRSSITVGELRSIWVGLARIIQQAQETPIIVQTDSQDALAYIRSWQKGNMRYPKGYSLYHANGAYASLLVFSRRLQRKPAVTFQWVRGHSGDILNETADSLAKMALRTMNRRWRQDLDPPRLAKLWAERSLSAFQAASMKVS